MIGNRLQTPRRRSRMSLDSFLAKLLAANATSEVRPCDQGGRCECAAQARGRAVAQERERRVNSPEVPMCTGGLPHGLSIPPKLYKGGPSACDVLGLMADLDSDE